MVLSCHSKRKLIEKRPKKFTKKKKTEIMYKTKQNKDNATKAYENFLKLF